MKRGRDDPSRWQVVGGGAAYQALYMAIAVRPR